MTGLESIQAAQEAVLKAWWVMTPREGWTDSRLTWSRVVNSVWRQVTLIWDDGAASDGPFTEELARAMEQLQDAFGAVGQPRPMSFTLHLTNQGQMTLRASWNDRVWFGHHHDAPFMPPTDPQIDIIPTDEMWARELELHPREADMIPDWWRDLLALRGTSVLSARVGGQQHRRTRDELLEAPVHLTPIQKAVQQGWGWADVFDQLNASVTSELATADDALIERLLAGDTEARELIEAHALQQARTHRTAWTLGHAVTLLREWNLVTDDPEPNGLAQLELASTFDEAVTQSLAARQVQLKIDQVCADVVRSNIQQRIGSNEG